MKQATAKNWISPATRVLRGIPICLAILILAASPAPAAIAAEQAESKPNPNGVTEVEVDVWGISIYDIDDRNATFEVEAYLSSYWSDERLAFDPGETGYDLRVLQGGAVSEALKTEIWWPGFEIIDARKPRDIMQRSIQINEYGDVDYYERFSVAITQPYDLYYFPFDRHPISFSVGLWHYDTDRVKFMEPAAGRPSNEPVDWLPEEWTVEEGEGGVAVRIGSTFCSVSQDMHCGDNLQCPTGESCEDSGYNHTTVELEIVRDPSHYLTNIVLPMILIVLISSAVFSMSFRTTHLGDRLGVSFTSVLTVVAFDFVTSERLPTLPYSTVLDNILTVSYIFLAINVLQNVIAARVNDHNPKAAERLDRLFRWGFPLIYITTVCTIIYYAGGFAYWWQGSD